MRKAEMIQTRAVQRQKRPHSQWKLLWVGFTCQQFTGGWGHVLGLLAVSSAAWFILLFHICPYLGFRGSMSCDGYDGHITRGVKVLWVLTKFFSFEPSCPWKPNLVRPKTPNGLAYQSEKKIGSKIVYYMIYMITHHIE